MEDLYPEFPKYEYEKEFVFILEKIMFPGHCVCIFHPYLPIIEVIPDKKEIKKIKGNLSQYFGREFWLPLDMSLNEIIAELNKTHPGWMKKGIK